MVDVHLSGVDCAKLVMVGVGRGPLDGPPFNELEMAVSLAALFMTVLILSTQRRDDELASHRDQLTLELAILSDRKVAKVIDLSKNSDATIPLCATGSITLRLRCRLRLIRKRSSMRLRIRTRTTPERGGDGVVLDQTM
jgi:uncharacterized membrane protein